MTGLFRPGLWVSSTYPMTAAAEISLSSTPMRTWRTQYATRSSSPASGRYSPARSAAPSRRSDPALGPGRAGAHWGRGGPRPGIRSRSSDRPPGALLDPRLTPRGEDVLPRGRDACHGRSMPARARDG